MPANMMVQATNIESQPEKAPSTSNSPAPLKALAIKPTSEILSTLNTPNLESEELNKWFEDLAQYERMLEEMSRANLDSSFKEELGSVENWFSALSEAERTAALFSLLHQCTNVQVRFFITVLQKLTVDPAHDLISPAFPPKFGLQTVNEVASGKTEGGNNLMAPENGVKRRHGHSKSVSIGDASIMGYKPVINRGVASRPVALDVKKASANEWSQNYSPISLSIKSASFVKDSTWGKAPSKVKNPKNLNLKVENKAETGSFAYPKTPKTPKTPKSALKSLNSPAFPPGLSPISWAATPHNPSFSPSQYSQSQTSTQNTPSKQSFKDPKPPAEPTDFAVLENIPVWMRSLRLHKYTHLFETMYWKDIVVLDDEALEKKGVAALGARRKFLKVFAQVLEEAKEKNIDIPNQPTGTKTEQTEIKTETKTEQTETTVETETKVDDTTNATTSVQETISIEVEAPATENEVKDSQ
ncbi:hypothetical protein K502DRAFT_340853 [Neoconidiobolus thromboides FSU 785]|nr:hypothetical protein K502DRAFT_340853 [Neoconidiobolus thromboides FSU 785]